MQILWVLPKEKENKDVSFKNTVTLRKIMNRLSQLISQDIEALSFSFKRGLNY